MYLTIFKINKIRSLTLELFRSNCLMIIIFLSVNLAICLTQECLGQEIVVKNIEFKDLNLNESQLKIKLSKKTNFKIYTLRNPHRLVIDIENAQLANEKYGLVVLKPSRLISTVQTRPLFFIFIR